MIKKEFKQMIKDYDSDCLAWWTPEETEEMNIQHRTIESLRNEGVLIYEHNDDLYVGTKTYDKIYK